MIMIIIIIMMMIIIIIMMMIIIIMIIKQTSARSNGIKVFTRHYLGSCTYLINLIVLVFSFPLPGP